MDKVMKIERPRQVSEVVLERLRTDIISGHFALGEKISEGQLSENYGVTKAPIRSAVSRLLAEGLVVVQPQSGTYVFKPSVEDLSALCELRIALELEATYLSMKRNYDELLASQTKICDHMKIALEQGAQDKYQRLDTKYHLSFFNYSSSPYLLETYEARVSNAFAALRFRFSQNKAHNEASIQEHREMCDYISERDYVSLAKAQRRHIQNTKTFYQELLEKA